MARPASPLSLHARGSGPAVVTVAEPELTNDNAWDLAEQLTAALGGGLPPDLVIDLGQVEVLTGVPLGQLIALSRKARQAGGRLTVENVAPLVADVLRISGVDQLVEVRHLAA